ncbi:hypothetical protein LSH36_431g01016 [Paralvinella palmiformis]|uniref:INO80 complex subunit F domain-containing protein n=1 Tax=Paralvinella palmiformis TaxID=53620 RepID=A0AAD9MZY5_9ANNE|nr:hypothetical protein LSH36_431g01016 [Paralvinella palmiformis]
MTNMVDLYQKKYSILKRRCEELHKTNDRLLSRIHQVQILLTKYQNESRMFMEELGKGGDDFREEEIPPVCEVDGNCDSKETGESSSFSDTPSSLPTEQESIPVVSSPNIVPMDTDTSPPSTSPSTTTSTISR